MIKAHYWMRNLIVITVVLISLESCTVSKRVHRKGYYISWQKSNDRKAMTEVNDSINVESSKIELASDGRYLKKNSDELRNSDSPQGKIKSKYNSKNTRWSDNSSKEQVYRSTLTQHVRKNKMNIIRYTEIEDKQEDNGLDRLKTGKLMVFIGIGAFLLFGSLGTSTALGVTFGILSLIALIVIIWGVVWWIQGRRRQLNNGQKKERSEESKRLLRLSLLFFVIGISLALGTAALFYYLEPVAAATGNVVTEVATITFGVISAYILLFLTILAFFTSIVFLFRAMMVD